MVGISRIHVNQDCSGGTNHLLCLKELCQKVFVAKNNDKTVFMLLIEKMKVLINQFEKNMINGSNLDREASGIVEIYKREMESFKIKWSRSNIEHIKTEIEKYEPGSQDEMLDTGAPLQENM